VWSATTGEERHRLALGVQATSLSIAPDGSRLLVGRGSVRTAWLVDLPAGRALARLVAVQDPKPWAEISDVAWASDPSLAATRTQEAVDLWSARDGRHLRRLPSCGAGRSLVSLDRGDALLLDCPDGFARVLDVASGAERRRLRLEGSHLPLRASPDGRWVAVASYSHVKLLELATGAEAGVFGGPEVAGNVASVGFAPDGRTLAIGTGHGKVVLFDLTTRAQLRVLEAQLGAVLALAFSPDARTLATGGASHTVRLFDVATGAERAAAAAHGGAVRGLAFSPTGDTLISAGADASVRRWDHTGRATSVRSLERPALAVFSLSASRVAVVEEGRVHVYDVASGWEVTGAPLPGLSRHEGIAVAPTAELLAVGGASSLHIVNLATGERRSFPVPRREEALAFSPDGLVLATLREHSGPQAGRPLVLRDAATGQELASVPSNLSGVPRPFRCRSADGSYFGFNAGLWRLGSDPKSRLESHGGPGRAAGPCAVSPDGRFVAFPRDEPDTIDIRERVRGDSGQTELRHVATLSGHRGPVTSLVFAPDSRTLASGGADSSVLLWDAFALGPPAEAPPPRVPGQGPRLQLSFDDGIQGRGVTPVRVPADSPLQLSPGRQGQALRPAAALDFPETRELVLGDEFTVSVAFRMGVEGLRSDTYQGILSSELITLDVREGGKLLLFLHFRLGGHVSLDLGPWIGRVQPGRWYHVAVSSRGADGEVRVCVDGVCGPGPGHRNYADRVGALTLARSTLSHPFAGEIDDLLIYDRALSDDEMAALDGLPRAVALPSPTPVPTPTPPPPPPAEQEPLPREGLPEGKDVASHVTVEERTGFTVYRFGGPLARAQTLDLDLGMGAVWVGTSLGLLRHDPRTESWRLWDETSGLPGERLYQIAVVGGRVIVDSSTPTSPGNVRGTGVLAFEVAKRTWTPMKDVGRVWDLWGDGSTLWVGTGNGAEARDLETGALRRFTRAAGELVHDTVHAVRRHGETVAFAALGDYVKDTKDFDGGGVTLWDRRRNEFRSYTPKDGLVRAYSCDVFLDDTEVFVAHWHEERGLSRIDRRTGRVEALRRSANGIDLGGVELAGDRETLWIGQQGALVRLDRASRQATALRERDGLPGYIVSGIVIGEDAVWASLYASGQDGVRSAGLVRFPRR
jgi:WD40 repeat protein